MDDSKIWWGTEIGIIMYRPTNKTNKKISNSEVNRITDIAYGNGDGTKSIGNIQRCDAALSADHGKLLIWTKAYTKDTGKRVVQYSFYDFDSINQELRYTKTKISLKGRKTKNSVLQRGADVVMLQKSMQGIELTNAMNVYMTSGKYNKKDQPDIFPLVCKISDKGKLEKIVRLNERDFYSYEIEGVKIVGEQLYIMIAIGKTEKGPRIFEIVSIDKNLL